MKISIITISYNQATFIEKAIRSVLNQKKDVDLEYIIVDAGSNDGSREIIESYQDQVDHIIFEPDEGPADGLNKGFKIASGDIYGYLNADDELNESCLKDVIVYFESNIDVDVISAHGEIIDEENHVMHKCFSHKFSLFGYAQGLTVLVQQSTFFRQQVFKSSGGFNKNNRVSWDGELAVDMALIGAKFKTINRLWSKFRVYETSISGSGLYLDKAKLEHKRIAKKTGLSAPSKIPQRILWLYFRLTDPITTSRRFFDQIMSGKRQIPT